MKMFNHIQIKVKDLKASRQFYDAIMKALGHSIIFILEIKDTVLGYGTSVHDMFEIRQFDEKSPLSQSIHLAFNAKNTLGMWAIAEKNNDSLMGICGFMPLKCILTNLWPLSQKKISLQLEWQKKLECDF